MRDAVDLSEWFLRRVAAESSMLDCDECEELIGAGEFAFLRVVVGSSDAEIHAIHEHHGFPPGYRAASERRVVQA